MKEILTVGKLAYEVREHHYDLVVVDAAATGHVVGQLASPQAINDLVHVGVVRDQTRWMIDILDDPARTGVVIVTTPEEMPVVETIELAGRLRDETNVDLAAVVVNRVLPELFGRGEEEVFERLRSPEASRVLEAKVGAGAVDVLDAAELAVQLRRTRVEHLETLRTALPPEVHDALRPRAVHAEPRACACWPGCPRRWPRSCPDEPPPLHPPVVGTSGSGPPTGPTPMVAATVEQLLAAKEIVVTTGSGGVGKTTVAAALGTMAARAPRRQGARAHRRPGPPAGDRPRPRKRSGTWRSRCRPTAFAAAGLKPEGELWVAMLDTQQSWDDLVRRHAPDAKTRDAILANAIYQNISGRFVQSHDYIAMERLYELHASGRFDLIVVDTPPTRHALDFLDAPARMADFFGSRLLRWLTAPYRNRIMTMASKPFYTMADRILGTKFLEDIAEFFSLMQTMEKGFVARSREVARILGDRRTTFVVVTTLEAAPVHEAEFFIDALRERHLHLGAVVLNKVLPGVAARRGRHRRRRRAAGPAAIPLGVELAPLVHADADQVARVLAEVAAELPQLPGGGQARGRAAGRAGGHLRGDGDRALLRRGHHRPRRPGPPRPTHLVALIGSAWASLRSPEPRGASSLALPSAPAVVLAPQLLAWRSRCRLDRVPGLRRTMATLAELARRHTALGRDDVLHLQRLVGEWGMLADFCFADLLLYAPTRDGGWFVLGQVRPGHQPDALPGRLGGLAGQRRRAAAAGHGLRGRRHQRGRDHGREAWPSRRAWWPSRSATVARSSPSLTREWSPRVGRQPGELERTYLAIFGRFADMIAEGSFPFDSEQAAHDGHRPSRRRRDGGRRRRPGHLHVAERRLGAAPRRDQRQRRRASAWPSSGFHDVTGAPGLRPARARDRGVRPGARAHAGHALHPAARRLAVSRAACCSCATSASCAGGTGCSCPRTPRSKRSTTG